MIWSDQYFCTNCGSHLLNLGLFCGEYWKFNINFATWANKTQSIVLVSVTKDKGRLSKLHCKNSCAYMDGQEPKCINCENSFIWSEKYCLKNCDQSFDLLLGLLCDDYWKRNFGQFLIPIHAQYVISGCQWSQQVMDSLQNSTGVFWPHKMTITYI